MSLTLLLGAAKIASTVKMMVIVPVAVGLVATGIYSCKKTMGASYQLGTTQAELAAVIKANEIANIRANRLKAIAADTEILSKESNDRLNTLKEEHDKKIAELEKLEEQLIIEEFKLEPCPPDCLRNKPAPKLFFDKEPL